MDIRRVRGLILSTVLRWVDMVAGASGAFDQGRVDDGGGGLFQLQAMALKLAADLGQQIIVDTALHKRIAQAAMCGFIRHRRVQAQPAKHHEIQPHLQGSLKFRVRQPMPLADQQTLEKDQRIITLRPNSRPLQATLENGRKRPPIHQCVDLREHIIGINPPRRFTQEKVHQPPQIATGKLYQRRSRAGIPVMQRS